MGKADKLIKLLREFTEPNTKTDIFGFKQYKATVKEQTKPATEPDKPKIINLGNKTLNKYKKPKGEDEKDKKEYLGYPMIKMIPGSEG